MRQPRSQKPAPLTTYYEVKGSSVTKDRGTFYLRLLASSKADAMTRYDADSKTHKATDACAASDTLPKGWYSAALTPKKK